VLPKTRLQPIHSLLLAALFLSLVLLGACSTNNPVVDITQADEADQQGEPPTELANAAEDTDADSGADDASTGARSERPTLTAEQEIAYDPTGVLADMIDISGGDPAGAPAGAVQMGNAVFCGFDIVRATGNGLEEDPEARGCFIDGISRGVETVMVQSLPLTETEQEVHVYRFEPNRDAIVSYDYSGAWSERVCGGIEPAPNEGPNAFVLTSCS